MYGLKITDEREALWKAQLAKQGWMEGLKEKEFDLLEHFCIAFVPKASPGVSEFSSAELKLKNQVYDSLISCTIKS